MPKIIQEDKRVAALNEIEASLGIIRSINAALGEKNSYIVTAVCPDARAAGQPVRFRSTGKTCQSSGRS